MLYRAALVITLLSIAYVSVGALGKSDDVDVDPAYLECFEGCIHCKLVKNCINSYPTFYNCIPNEVCESNNCIGQANATSCSCYGEPDGSYRDPYNPRFYYTCLLEQENFFACPSEQIFSLTQQACIDLPVCSDIGCFPVDGDCQSYYCCQKSGTDFTQDVFSCEDGSVYNHLTGACESVSPTCTQSGIESDALKCDVYHVCSGPDDENPGSFCCPVGEKYDTTTFNCIPDDGTCANVDICYDAYYETRFCNRCTSTSDIFPTRDQCSGYYYGCVVATPGFRQVLQECPAGTVFNPAGSYCDLPENVGC